MQKRTLYKDRSTPRQVMQFMRNKADNTNNYVSWIEFDKEPVIRTWAFKETKSRGFEYTEVQREALNMIIWKNLVYYSIAGYQVLYGPKTNTYYSYDFDVWEEIEKPVGVSGRLLNLEDIFQGKYKYCGYQPRCGELMEYLRLFEQYPEVEYLGKLGVQVKISIIRKCKDKQFVRFLIDHAEEIKIHGGFTEELLFAYKNKIGIIEARQKLREKKWAERSTRGWTNIQTKGLDRIRLAQFAYKEGMSCYRDYWEAINYLGYDILDTKNTYPKDFDRMHDLRIAEYDSKKAKEDAKKVKSFNKQIMETAKKYEPALIENENLCVLFPNGVNDFRREGEKLHHCVGKMGYDKKMAEGKSLIAFIRKKKAIKKPFITVEIKIDLSKPYLNQIYGDHGSKPSDQVQKFGREFEKAVIKQAAVLRKELKKAK